MKQNSIKIYIVYIAAGVIISPPRNAPLAKGLDGQINTIVANAVIVMEQAQK